MELFYSQEGSEPSARAQKDIWFQQDTQDNWLLFFAFQFLLKKHNPLSALFWQIWKTTGLCFSHLEQWGRESPLTVLFTLPTLTVVCAHSSLFLSTTRTISNHYFFNIWINYQRSYSWISIYIYIYIHTHIPPPLSVYICIHTHPPILMEDMSSLPYSENSLSDFYSSSFQREMLRQKARLKYWKLLLLGYRTTKHGGRA